MPYLAGPFLALVAWMAVSGVSKVITPGPTAGALRGAGLPHSIPVVRSLGVVEAAVGVAGIVSGGRATALAAACLFGVFAVFVSYALSHDLPISSCGCFGATETPPSVVHVIVDSGAAALLLLVAVFPVGPWGGMADAPVGLVVPFAAFTGATVYLLYAVVTALPRAATPAGRTPVTLTTTRRTSDK